MYRRSSLLACHESGLGLRFEPQADGSVAAYFACAPNYQGYPGRLHGGVVSMLLDAAMTNCLFARGIQAVTGEFGQPMSEEVKAAVDLVVEALIRVGAAAEPQ